jgi:hypothetical protein
MVSGKFALPTSPVGIIDSLASGFEIVAKHLQILLLPLSIDLFLWLGPRFTFRPFMPGLEQFFRWLAKSATGPDNDQVLQWIKQTQDLAQNAPALYLPVILPPTLLGGRRASGLPFEFKPIVIDTMAGNVLGIILALFGSLILYEICFGWIAQYVLNEPMRLWRFTRQVASVTVQSVLALVVGIIIFTGSTLVLMLILGIASLAGSDFLEMMILTFYMGIAIPCLIMVTFTLHSMYLNHNNVIVAMWDSIRVVNWNMLPTAFLLGLGTLIFSAMNIVCLMADQGSWLVLVAMAGNAFISTGLIAGTFVYYKDRYRYWRELREALLAEIERRRAQQDQNRQV